MKDHHLNKIIFVLASLVVICLAFVGGFYLSKLPINQIKKQSEQQIEQIKIDNDVEIQAPQIANTDQEKVATVNGIEWHEPIELYDVPVFVTDEQYDGVHDDFVLDSKQFFSVGKIIDSKHKYYGGEIIRATIPIATMGEYYAVVFFIKSQNQFIFPNTFTDGAEIEKNIVSPTVTIDPTFSLPNLLPPKEVTFENGMVLKFGSVDDPGAFTYSTIGKIDYQLIGTTKDSREVFIVKSPTNTNSYSLVNSYFYLKTLDGMYLSYTHTPVEFDEVPNIIFTRGEVNIDPYDYGEYGGCGMSSSQVKIEGIPESDFEVVGALNGELVYEPRGKGGFDLRKDKFESVYNYSRLEYNNSYPILALKDKLGRYIKIENRRFQPAAECGKPVIYLYPEKETEVNVRVAPVGGFSYTDPEYNETTGWNVIAQPTGELVEKNTGITYPYLFWEGRGGMYEIPKKGWVVARKDVPALITEKLQAFNLNEKEIADFNEFWLPRMQKDPYYFITFMGTRTMNELAPLTITPKPDTIIRVLMDYEGLQEPKQVEGYEIHAPARKGFTVIEWGGVLGR